MFGVIEELERRYDGVRGYLRAGGTEDRVMEWIRGRLTA
jgi:hypothetical protein